MILNSGFAISLPRVLCPSRGSLESQGRSCRSGWLRMRRGMRWTTASRCAVECGGSWPWPALAAPQGMRLLGRGLPLYPALVFLRKRVVVGHFVVLVRPAEIHGRVVARVLDGR